MNCSSRTSCGASRRTGRGLLLAITNDAWYGRTGAPYQFLAMTALRAAESGRLDGARGEHGRLGADRRRAATCGAQTRIFERGLLVGEVALRRARTAGPPSTCATATGSPMLCVLRRPRRRLRASRAARAAAEPARERRPQPAPTRRRPSSPSALHAAARALRRAPGASLTSAGLRAPPRRARRSRPARPTSGTTASAPSAAAREARRRARARAARARSPSALEDAEVLLELGRRGRRRGDARARPPRSSRRPSASSRTPSSQRLLGGEHDAANAIVSINAGRGRHRRRRLGRDAAAHVPALGASAHGFTTEILDVQAGEEAGIRSVTFTRDRASTPTAT